MADSTSYIFWRLVFGFPGVPIKYIWPFGTSLADKTGAKMIRADQGSLSENLGLCWRGTGGMVIAFNKPP